ncbi:DUF1996 domain-containing protein [Parasphingorhabdus cellanae]|uniref:DUF1996 domain-containing protein n=1 Tax=Parasphingorhabdus cellanae TaxID=2806553 RepID=A0ABX7T3U3_9SPHN|nr:DUF1996 domain-containing protein [Parasphingorhabdus cellanae]QTD56245.1 DUF1996 domain-containing protein [Parasphingorhabdus cellanae]
MIFSVRPALAEQGAIPPGLELPPIPSNFDVEQEYVAGWGSGKIPKSAAPDVVGAFRFLCSPGQLSYDDPIVYPGKPGKSHLHQFFGNTGANAYSTYESLRKTGDSTCNNRLNRSAYWMPAMLNGRGQVVKPRYVSIYYKRIPESSPDCLGRGKNPQNMCITIPRGLRYIFGHDMLDKSGKKTGKGYFNCYGPGAKSGTYPDIVTAAQYCPVGAKIGALISAPDCWDGRNLDSPDHRAHVAYRKYGNDGKARCPKTHPYRMPTFTLGSWYDVDETLDRSGRWDPDKPSWHLSSDYMPGMKPAKPGSTFHTDWFGAWDDEALALWTAHCINKLLNCSGGELGNGKQLKPTNGYNNQGQQRIFDPPPDPGLHHHVHGNEASVPNESDGNP